MIASKTQNKAAVPSNPLTKSNPFCDPQGDIFSFEIINRVIPRLITALTNTISATGSRPPRYLTQTVIKLKAKALAKRYWLPFFAFEMVLIFNSLEF